MRKGYSVLMKMGNTLDGGHLHAKGLEERKEFMAVLKQFNYY